MPGARAIRVLIVDDEVLARERVRDLLSRHTDIHIIGECANGDEAATVLQHISADIMFLDVQMPEADGFEAIEAIPPARLPYIIFISAFDHYAVRAFELNALDYLLKPFDRERFEKTLTRARTAINSRKDESLGDRLISVLETVKTNPSHLERLIVKNNGHVCFVKAEEIDWIEAEGNYVRLHTARESHLLRETISALENCLDPKKFLRVHRSTIINIDRVKEMQSWFHGEYRIIMQSGAELMLSRNYRDRLNEFLGKNL
jgi:two-component system LytT family response regulator